MHTLLVTHHSETAASTATVGFARVRVDVLVHYPRRVFSSFAAPRTVSLNRWAKEVCPSPLHQCQLFGSPLLQPHAHLQRLHKNTRRLRHGALLADDSCLTLRLPNPWTYREGSCLCSWKENNMDERNKSCSATKAFSFTQALLDLLPCALRYSTSLPLAGPADVE